MVAVRWVGCGSVNEHRRVGRGTRGGARLVRRLGEELRLWEVRAWESQDLGQLAVDRHLGFGLTNFIANGKSNICMILNYLIN